MKDSKEKINMCLDCNKCDCDNCIESKVLERVPKVNGKKRYVWKGMIYSLKELAEIKNFPSRKMRYRIATGGIDFAMSNFKTRKAYEISKKVGDRNGTKVL